MDAQQRDAVSAAADSDASRAPRLVDRDPTLSAAELAAALIPPPQFRDASFENYRPDPEYPSQAEALRTCRDFAEGAAPVRGLFGRGRKRSGPSGIYLDGGFGVGKTHLLAALWHGSAGPKLFGTFIEYTALVGAIGYAATVRLLTGYRFIAIDEFELDDPGDTMLMTRLLGELSASGTRFAATSNTPPNALGEGRFAAADFLREIQALSSRFETVRIDGIDYRRRDIEGHARALAPEELDETVRALGARGLRYTLDDFGALVSHLASLHPSKYVTLIDDLDAIVLSEVEPLVSQADALRFVAFVDRVYDAQIPVYASGVPLDEVFAGDMMGGGYRKKYLRAQSRLIASTRPAD